MYRGFTPPTPPASRWINSSSTPITRLGQEPEIEVAMKTLLSVLLPATAGNTIHGMKLPVYVFIVLASSALFEAASTFWRPMGAQAASLGWI